MFLWRLAEMLRDTKKTVKVLLLGHDTDFSESDLDVVRLTIDRLQRGQILSRLSWNSATLPHRPFT